MSRSSGRSTAGDVQRIELREEAGDGGAITSLGFSWDGWRPGLRKKPQIVVHVDDGGCVSSVQANREDVQVTVIDYDDFPQADHEKICRETEARHEIKTLSPDDWDAATTLRYDGVRYRDAKAAFDDGWTVRMVDEINGKMWSWTPPNDDPRHEPHEVLMSDSAAKLPEVMQLRTAEVPVYYEVDARNEATGTTHWYCSPACRSAAAIDPNALECGAVDCKAGNAVPPTDDLVCETCGKLLADLVVASQQEVDEAAKEVLERVTQQLAEDEHGNRKVLLTGRTSSANPNVSIGSGPHSEEDRAAVMSEAPDPISDLPHQRKYHHTSSALADGWTVASVPVDYCPRNWLWTHPVMPEARHVKDLSAFRSTGPDSLPPALRAMSYQIRGSYGALTVDEAGEVLQYEPSDEATDEDNYRDIAKVDIDGYVKQHGEMADTDIILMGFWDKAGNYTAAEELDRQDPPSREVMDLPVMSGTGDVFEPVGPVEDKTAENDAVAVSLGRCPIRKCWAATAVINKKA